MSLYNPWGSESPVGGPRQSADPAGSTTYSAIFDRLPKNLYAGSQFQSSEEARRKREGSYDKGLGIMEGLAGYGGGQGGGGMGGFLQDQPLMDAARSSLMRNLSPKGVVQNTFGPETANLIGGQAKETAAAQYGEQERKLREALANKSVSQGEFMSLMGELQRNRVGAEQEAYRTPAIEQAKYSGQFALQAQEASTQRQQLALAALQSIWGQMFGAGKDYASMLGNAPYQGADYSPLMGMDATFGGWNSGLGQAAARRLAL